MTAFQVFEHLPDPVGALRLLAQSLVPGGVVLIEVPNIETLAVRLLRGRHRHFVPDHLTFFSARTLTALLKCAGLEVRQIYHPTRWMSLHHLFSRYLTRIGPAAAQGLLARMIVPVNIRDIIAVIGWKPYNA